MNPILIEIKNLLKLLKNENLSQKEIEEIELEIFRKCFELRKLKIPI